jgi:A nuclease of the HNH/ENDO VII superfamily with conserved WHH
MAHGWGKRSGASGNDGTGGPGQPEGLSPGKRTLTETLHRYHPPSVPADALRGVAGPGGVPQLPGALQAAFDGPASDRPTGPSALAGFLRLLTPEMVKQSPDPLLVERGAGGHLRCWLTLPEPVPWGELIAWSCKVTDERGQCLAEAGAILHSSVIVLGPVPVEIPRLGAYQLTWQLRGRDTETRTITRPLAIRAPDLDAARGLTDAQVAADAASFDRRLATLATTTDASERRILLRGRQELEWLQHERGTARPFEAPDERYQRLPTEPMEMRQYLEPLVARRGIASVREHLYNVALGNDMEPQLQQYELGLSQLQRIESDMQAFRAELLPATRQAAEDILEQSEQEIAAGFSSYGLAVDQHVLKLAAMFQLKDDDLLDSAVEVIMNVSASGSPRFPGQPDRFSAMGADRAALVGVARELKSMQTHVSALQDQRDRLRAVHPPPAAGIDPDRVGVEEDLAGLALALAKAQAQLQTRWLEAEQAHPILAAYRSPGRDIPDLGGLGVAADGDAAMRAVLRAVLPKVKNIYRVRIGLGDEVDPLELPPAVELAKQRLHVPPGSVRARVVDEAVREAAGADWKDWAILAVTLGMAVISAFATGGSTLGIAAELAGVALDAYMFEQALDEYGMGQALANTSLDRARSLSQSEPSLAWLAVQLVGLKWSAATTVRTFREAAAVRHAVRAGEAVDEAAVHALDAAGEQAGLGQIGQRVVNEASTSTDGMIGAGTGAGAGRTLARHPLYGDVVGELASSNLEALGRRLGTQIQLDEVLGTGVEVVFHVDEASDLVSILAIKAGRLALAADVLAHAKTIKLLQRYNGAWGQFRRRLDELLALISGGAVARPGSEAWKARIEAEKIRRIAASRRRALVHAPTGALEQILSDEIAFLDEQAEMFEAIAAEARSQVAVGVVGIHAVGMPDTSKLRAAARLASDTSGSFKHGTRGIPPPPRGAAPPPIPAGLRPLVDRVASLPSIHPVEEATRWIPKARAGDPAGLRTELAKVAREHAEAAEAALRAAAGFGALAAKDSEAAERIAVHVHHRAAQQYFVHVEKGAISLANDAERQTARGVHEAADDYASADMILDAVGVKPVRGNLPANHESAGTVIPRSDFVDYPEAQKLIDAKGMPGIPISPSGQPDFTRWIYEKGGIKGDVEIPKLTGSYPGDFDAADADAGFTAANSRPQGWTWHHHEGTRMILIPRDLHMALTHLGPAAHYRGITGVKDAYR